MLPSFQSSWTVSHDAHGSTSPRGDVALLHREVRPSREQESSLRMGGGGGRGQGVSRSPPWSAPVTEGDYLHLGRDRVHQSRLKGVAEMYARRAITS